MEKSNIFWNDFYQTINSNSHLLWAGWTPPDGIGDYGIKLRNLTRFINEGNKTKVTLRFRGREMAHRELGMEMLKRVEADLADIALVEQAPAMEGRQMVMVLAPRLR